MAQVFGIGNQHLDFGDVFLRIALEYHPGAFQIDFPCRQCDLVFMLLGKLGDLLVGRSDLIVGACVD